MEAGSLYRSLGDRKVAIVSALEVAAGWGESAGGRLSGQDQVSGWGR